MDKPATSQASNEPTNIVPLDSPLRTTPIHPLLPHIRVLGRAPDAEIEKETESNKERQRQQQQQQPDNAKPEKQLQTHQYNPLTCAPFPTYLTSLTPSKKNQPDTQPNTQDSDTTTANLINELTTLKSENPTPEQALKTQESTAREAKRRIEETTKKREEVQRAMDKKVMERDTELKVLSKYQQVKV